MPAGEIALSVQICNPRPRWARVLLWAGRGWPGVIHFQCFGQFWINAKGCLPAVPQLCRPYSSPFRHLPLQIFQKTVRRTVIPKIPDHLADFSHDPHQKVLIHFPANHNKWIKKSPPIKVLIHPRPSKGKWINRGRYVYASERVILKPATKFIGRIPPGGIRPFFRRDFIFFCRFLRL